MEGLSAAAAEAWCLDNLAISTLGLAPDRPFWLRFELRTGSRSATSRLKTSRHQHSRGLIEIFSRKNEPEIRTGDRWRHACG